MTGVLRTSLRLAGGVIVAWRGGGVFIRIGLARMAWAMRRGLTGLNNA
jgi:hypothetical protein